MSDTPLWTPTPAQVAQANLSRFMRFAGERHDRKFDDYAALYDWSVRESERFWTAVWDFCEVRAAARGEVVLADGDRMPGARWFPQARLNYAENLLRHCPPATRRRSRVLGRGQAQAPRQPRRTAGPGLALRPGAARVGRGAGRPRGRLSAEPARGHHRHARHRQPRRDLVVRLAGLRRAGRAGPLRPDRAQGAGRAPTAISTTASRSTRLDRVARNRRRDAERGARGGGRLHRQRFATSPRSAARQRWTDFLAPFAAARARVRAAALRSSAVHPVFLGHHRRAQVHRARRRRHAAAAPEGAPAAHRREARRPRCSTSPPAAG